MLDIAKLQTGRKPTSLQDAVSMLQALELQNEENTRTAYRLGMDVIRNRFEQGRIVEDAYRLNSQGNGTTYGKDLMDALAQKAGVHTQMLRRCHALFRRAKTREGFHAQLARWEDQNINVTWSLCINWATKALPDDQDKAQEKIDKGFKSLERRLVKVKSDLLDMQEQVEQWEPERADELIGIATAVIETIEEVQTVRVEGLALDKPDRVEDSTYLNYVRGLPCINCGAPAPSQPHHTDRGGMATKGADYYCLPVCTGCHRQIHDTGDETFWRGANVWEFVARTLAGYLTL